MSSDDPGLEDQGGLDQRQEEEEGLPQSAKEFLGELGRVSKDGVEMSGEERAQWALQMSSKMDTALNDPDLSDPAREILESVIEESHLRASFAGMAFSTWLPPGQWRKVILYGLLGGVGVLLISGHWILSIACLALSGMGSPRVVGEALFWFGVAQRYSWPIIITLGIILYFAWGQEWLAEREAQQAMEAVERQKALEEVFKDVVIE